MIASIAVLGGIGFTVSLFIANLSFDSSTIDGARLLDMAKLGIVVGSLVAGIGGYLLLHKTLPEASDEDEDEN